MFSAKALTALLLVKHVHGGFKADCWADTDCTQVLTVANGCILDPDSSGPPVPGCPNYDSPPVPFTNDCPAHLYMGEPAWFCGNRKSLVDFWSFR